MIFFLIRAVSMFRISKDLKMFSEHVCFAECLKKKSRVSYFIAEETYLLIS
jgi:hypothetical protein